MTNDWLALNQKYLSAQLARLRALLQTRVAETAQSAAEETDASEIAPARAALDVLCEAFHLSAFERDTLLLCAGVELDSEIAALVARAQNDSQKIAPTFSLALALLPDAHWSALTPDAPLRHWRLLEIGGGSTLTTSPLRIDERVLHFLTGIAQLDARLDGIIVPLAERETLVESQQHIVEKIVRASEHAASPPVIQLVGNGRALAAAVCEQWNVPLFGADAQRLPTNAAELEAFIRLVERELMLTRGALLLDASHVEENTNLPALAHFLETVRGQVFLVTRVRRTLPTRVIFTFDVPKLSAPEQRAVWTQTLGEMTTSLNGHVEQLVAQFDLDAPDIHAAVHEARQANAAESGAALWEASRVQSRRRFDSEYGAETLAQRIETFATWDDIVLPDAQMKVLRDIAAHVRQRHRVYDEWGWREKSARGLGITALFAGASGTGKTMAGEVLANELQLDLYRIDLSAVVSKYIGETEKNLRRVFDAAEAGGAILLFDEADALFGKRSEVKDSHDRYANIEISYLLQRMEQYRGLAILTTNLQEHLDRAFVRRLRFIAQFPFPDAAQRAEIWRKIFPRRTPTEMLDAQCLARLNIAGGNIRNIALHASFLAADEQQRVTMSHLLRAAQSEYAKMNKTMTESEMRDWRLVPSDVEGLAAS